MIRLASDNSMQSSKTKQQSGNAFSTDPKSGVGALSALSDMSFLKMFDPNSPWVVSCMSVAGH